MAVPSDRCCLHPDCLAINCPEDVCDLDREKRSPLIRNAGERAIEARRLHAMGWTLTSIALRLGLAERTVYKYLSQQPVSSR